MHSSADGQIDDDARTGDGDHQKEVLGGLAPDFVRRAAAQRLRALGHPDRLRIIESLARRPAHVGELAAALGLSVGTTSRRLRSLRDADVVHCSRRGNHVLYALADRDVRRLAAVAYRGRRRRSVGSSPRRLPWRRACPRRPTSKAQEASGFSRSMMPDRCGGAAAMTATLSHVASGLPVLSLVLQGAASGALFASGVLCRARARPMHIEPWAVTAAWSLLGLASVTA